MTGVEITQICTAAVTIVTLILGFLSQRKQGNQIHTAVNSNLTQAQNRNEQLTAALTASNIDVPISKKESE